MTVDLFEVHGALATLLHAVNTELKDLGGWAHIEYHHAIYLRVVIEVRERNKQAVVDRLTHGVLNGPYDYRFRVSYPTSKADPYDRVVVHAYPDMFHDRRKKAAA